MIPLHILETVRLIRIARAGELRAWLGPALRGLAGGRLRASVCVLPVLEQITTRRYCRGCPQMAGCAYGETVEPDPPAGVHLAAGWENAARPLVVAPAFPLPELGQPGFTFPVRVVFVGTIAAGHADVFWDALRVWQATLAADRRREAERNPPPALTRRPSGNRVVGAGATDRPAVPEHVCG